MCVHEKLFNYLWRTFINKDTRAQAHEERKIHKEIGGYFAAQNADLREGLFRVEFQKFFSDVKSQTF